MFSWFKGQPKSNLPEPTALQTQKTKQIEQLRSFNKSVSEIHRDVEYRVNFVVNGTTISLYISLPPQFPQEKPVVKVSPMLTHPWVNESLTVTGCAGINNFVVHSDLGRVIRDIIEEFQTNPPVIQPQKHPYNVGNSSFQYSPDNSGGGGQVYQPPPYPTSPTTPKVSMYNIPPVTAAAPMSSSPRMPDYPVKMDNSTGYNMPDIPHTIAEIREMSNEELKELSDNEDKLLDILKNLPQVQQLGQDRENFCDQNELFAKENLAQRPLLEERKKLLLEKYDELNEARTRFDQLYQKQDISRSQFDVSAVRDNLNIAAAEAEEKAESVAERFLDGSLPVDEFKKQFMVLRTKGYLRRAKEEKVTQGHLYT